MRIPEKEWVIFDLEFTDPNLCHALKIPAEPIEIGACRFSLETGEVKGTFERIIQPTKHRGLTDDILNLTRLSLDSILQASKFSEVWREFLVFTGRTRLVSWTGIDHEVLRNAYTLAEVSWPHHNNPVDAMSVVMGIAMAQGWRPKSFGLKSVCSYLGIPRTDSHRALSDATAVANIMCLLINKEIDSGIGNSGR